jgi:dTDP-4-dehydrorhamnose 3,5-epimerase
MERIDLAVCGSFLLRPKVFTDHRGFFLETYHKAQLEALGLRQEFVQDNHSASRRGTIRGMHYQLRFPQGKLCRVVVGEVLDVVLDIRVGSPTFGKWAGARLTADNKDQIWIPPGCAHGFSVLSERAEFLYKCTDYYHPEDDCGVLATDPELGIDWQVPEPVMSAKDHQYLPLGKVPAELLPKFAGA